MGAGIYASAERGGKNLNVEALLEPVISLIRFQSPLWWLLKGNTYVQHHHPKLE